MSYSNAHRLARARDILLGAHIAMGITQSDALIEDASSPRNASLPRGVYSVAGAQGKLNEALAQCAHLRSWIAVTALPEIGWERLNERGICLERIVVIPTLDIAPERILYTLAGVMDILCVGEIPLTANGRKRIAAKARQKSCTILTTTTWPGISRPFPLGTQNLSSLTPRNQEAVGI